MRQIGQKEKSMVARMAGNIAGPLLATTVADSAKSGAKAPDGFVETIGIMAVAQACAILDAIESRVPCGQCDECHEGIQCREVGTGLDDGESTKAGHHPRVRVHHDQQGHRVRQNLRGLLRKH